MSPATHFVNTQPYTNMCMTFLMWGQPSKIIISGRTPSTYKQLPVDFKEHQRVLLRLWRKGWLDGDFLIASRVKIKSLPADREGNNTDGLPTSQPPGNAWRRRARGLGFVEEYERRFNQQLKDLACWARTDWLLGGFDNGGEYAGRGYCPSQYRKYVELGVRLRTWCIEVLGLFDVVKTKYYPPTKPEERKQWLT